MYDRKLYLRNSSKPFRMDQYFLTYGRGMKEFVVNEVKSKIESANKTNERKFQLVMIEESIEGKLIFSTNLPFETLSSLKTVERLFALILFEKFNEKNAEKQSILDLITNNFNFDFNSSKFIAILSNWTECFELDDKDESECSSSIKKLRKSFSFRVDCKLTGKWRKLDEVKSSLVKSISEKISKLSNLESTLENPDLIITCHLTDLCFIIGIAITKNSLSVRSYIKNVGLRSTVCAAMIQVANPDSSVKGYTLILDPFCGKSTIQTEYLEYLNNQNSKTNSLFICADRNLEQIESSRINLTKYQTYDFVLNCLKTDVVFPYRDNCVDLIITDLPFGINHPIQYFDSNHGLFYKKLLIEIDRLLVRPGGVCVLLLNSNETKIFETQLEDLSQRKQIFLRLVSKHPLSLGETNAHIYKLANI